MKVKFNTIAVGSSDAVTLQLTVEGQHYQLNYDGISLDGEVPFEKEKVLSIVTKVCVHSLREILMERKEPFNQIVSVNREFNV